MQSKAVLISGCSSGIGLSTAVACLKRGARVFAGMRKPEKQRDALEKAAATAGVSTDLLSTVQLDVTNDSSVQMAVRSTMEQTDNQIDYLINNAGEGLNGTIETVSLERAKAHFDLNVWGVYRLVQAVAPVMREQGSGGHIVNISSASAYRSLPGFEVYGAGKFALDGLMQGYAGIAALDGIAVTNIQPGPVATEFVARLQSERAGAAEEDHSGETPMQRGLRNLALFNESRLAQATMTGGDVATIVADIMEQHARGEPVPLSLPVGDAATQAASARFHDINANDVLATSVDFVKSNWDPEK